MANNDKENKIKKFTKEAIGKTLNQFNKEIGIADLVEVNKNQDRILNGILSQVNDENTEKTEKSNIITLDNSTDGIVELKEIQGDTNVNVSKIEEMPITHDIGDKEGNVFTLNEIPKGAISIGEIQGNTMVNCNKDDKKELVLMKDLSTEGYSNITLTEGVNGGLVDVALEGNTLVNVCDQKDPVAITKSYTVETGNHVALQGEYDGKCRPVVTGNTLVNLATQRYLFENGNLDGDNITITSTAGGYGIVNIELAYELKPNTTYTVFLPEHSIPSQSLTFVLFRLYVEGRSESKYIDSSGDIFTLTTTSDTDSANYFRLVLSNGADETFTINKNIIILEGDYTDKEIPSYFQGLQSSFEDKVVTQEMVDAGEELAENLGKYKVDYVVTGKNKVGINNCTKTVIKVNDTYNAIDNIIFSNIKADKNTIYKFSCLCDTSDLASRVRIIGHHKKISNTIISHTGIYTAIVNKGLGKEFTPNNTLIGYEYYTITTGGAFPSDRASEGEIVTYSSIQLEEGSTATPYEPYKEYTKTLYLNSPLLEGDTIEQQGDNVVHVHRYKKVVFDGSSDESWTAQFLGDSDTTLGFRNQVGIYSKEKANALSDRFVYLYSWEKTDHIHFNRNALNITISKSKLQTQDVAGFRQWLQANPTTVVYELASPTYEVISQNDTILCDSYVNGHLDVDSVVPIEKVVFKDKSFILKYLYPSTEYTVQFESDGVGKVYTYMAGVSPGDKNIVKGINKFNLTTNSTISYLSIGFSGIGFNASNIVVTEATDQDFGYFEGMKSVGECEGNKIEILSSNKNLFNCELEIGHYNNSGNKGSSVSTIRCSEKIKCKPNTNYIFSGTAILNNSGWIKVLSKDGSQMRQFYSFNSPISTPAWADFIVFHALKENLDINGTIQLEEGSTATDYIPHAHNTQTLTHEPLRAVGDIKDKYVLIDGKWYIERNVAKVVLNGTETWRATGGGGHDTRNTFETVINKVHTREGVLKSICDKYAVEQVDDIPRNDNAYRVFNSGSFTSYFLFTPSTSIIPYRDTEAWKEWLSENPITIIVECSPSYEPIDYNPLEVYSGTTNITINSTIPTNIVVKNHGFNCLLKPSTTYTISSNLGLNTVTTPSTLSEDCLRFYDTDTSTVTTMNNVTILEGDYTTGKPIPSHFSGIESAFEQEYDEAVGKYKVKAKVVGKNLFDVQLANFNNYTLPGGAYKSCKIRLVQGNNYTLSVTGSGSTGEYYLLSTHANPNEKGAYWYPIIADGVSPINQTITAQKQDYYVCYWNANGVTQSNFNSLMSKIKVQIEQGSTTTPYEPYKENYIEFYIDEPLRGIGDVKDRVYVKDNKVVVERNCGSVTFDGSETGWVINNRGTINGLIAFWLMIKDKAFGVSNILSAKLPTKYGFKLFESIWGESSNTAVYLCIHQSKLQTQNVAGFKQWLQQNPITVVYQLAEPTYEEVEYSESRLFLNTYNNSTLFYESNIPVSNTSFKPLWEKLAYLKNSTKYYIQFNSTASGTVVFNLGGTEVTKDIVEGYNNIAITTPAETTNLLTIDGHGINISEVVISESVCGGHYLGLQSCFEEHMENGKYVCTIRGIALDGSKVNGIKLYLDEPLRGVGDTKDRLCIKDGKLMVERNCAEVMLGINSQWFRSTQDAENYLDMRCHINSPYSYPSDNGGICNTIPYKSNKNGSWITKDFGITCINVPNQIQVIISIEISKLKTPDINGFKQWLSENPTTVVYKLQKPIYEEVTNEYGYPIVLEGYENGIVYVDSAVIPTTSIKYTSNNVLATTLSETEGKNNSTLDDININVVTYMMDIDMLLTEMEMSNDISVMAVRRDNNNENMLDRMSEEDKKVYQDNTVVMLEKMITANVLDKEDIERRINMYYNKNRISKEQYNYLKSLL